MPSQSGILDTIRSVAGKVFTYLASITLTGVDGKTLTVTNDAEVGHGWSTHPFNAADYTGSGAMTVTVAAGDVAFHRYIIEGKKMTVAFDIETITIGGTPNTAILMKIPAAKTATTNYVRNATMIDDAGTRDVGWVYTLGTNLAFNLKLGGNFSLSADLTRIAGEIEFEIN